MTEENDFAAKMAEANIVGLAIAEADEKGFHIEDCDWRRATALAAIKALDAHRATRAPSPDMAEAVQGGALYVRFSEPTENGSEAIRHWSRHPFEGAMRFDHRVGAA